MPFPDISDSYIKKIINGWKYSYKSVLFDNKKEAYEFREFLLENYKDEIKNLKIHKRKVPSEFANTTQQTIEFGKLSYGEYFYDLTVEILNEYSKNFDTAAIVHGGHLP